MTNSSSTGQLPSAAVNLPGSIGLGVRRVSALLAWVLAIICAIAPRVIGAEPFYAVSFSAAVLIASFGFFASTIQGDLAFALGLAGLLVPLVITWVVAVNYLGSEQDWLTMILGVFTVVLAGFGALNRHQPNIWR